MAAGGNNTVSVHRAVSYMALQTLADRSLALHALSLCEFSTLQFACPHDEISSCYVSWAGRGWGHSVGALF